jgi:hypothetical protein
MFDRVPTGPGKSLQTPTLAPSSEFFNTIGHKETVPKDWYSDTAPRPRSGRNLTAQGTKWPWAAAASQPVANLNLSYLTSLLRALVPGWRSSSFFSRLNMIANLVNAPSKTGNPSGGGRVSASRHLISERGIGLPWPYRDFVAAVVFS